MPNSKINLAKLIADKFLKQNNHEDFTSLPGYWYNLGTKLGDLLKSPEVARLHRWKTSPADVDAFCKLQAQNYIDPAVLVQLAVEADQHGYFNTISDNPSLAEAIEHCDCHIEFYQPGGEYTYDTDTTDDDAETLLDLAERLKAKMPHLYYGYKLGLFN